MSQSHVNTVIEWAGQKSEALTEGASESTTRTTPSDIRIPNIKVPMEKGVVNEREIERILESRNRRDDLKRELYSCGEARQRMEKPERWFKGLVIYLLGHEEKLMADHDDYLSVIKIMEIGAYRYFQLLIRVTENVLEHRVKGKQTGSPLLKIDYEYTHFIRPIGKYFSNPKIISMFNKIKYQYYEVVICPIEDFIFDCSRRHTFPYKQYFALKEHFSILLSHHDFAKETERRQIKKAYVTFISCILATLNHQWGDNHLNLAKVFWVLRTQILETPKFSHDFPVVKDYVEKFLSDLLGHLADNVELLKDVPQCQLMVDFISDSEFNYLVPEAIKVHFSSVAQRLKRNNPFKSRDDFLDWIKQGWEVELSGFEKPEVDCRQIIKSEPEPLMKGMMQGNPVTQASESQSWARVASANRETTLPAVFAVEQAKKRSENKTNKMANKMTIKDDRGVTPVEVIHVSVEEALDKLEFNIFSNKAIQHVIPTRERVSNLLYGHEKIQNSLEGVVKYKKKKAVDKENQQQLAREWLLILASIHLRNIVGNVYGRNRCAHVLVLCTQRLLDKAYDILRSDPSTSRYGQYMAENARLFKDVHLTLLHLINAGLEEKNCHALRDQLSRILSHLAPETADIKAPDLSENISSQEDLFPEKKDVDTQPEGASHDTSDVILPDKTQRGDTVSTSGGDLVPSTATRSWAQLVQSSVPGKKALAAVVANPKEKLVIETPLKRPYPHSDLMKEDIFEKYNQPTDDLVKLAVTQKRQFDDVVSLFENGLSGNQKKDQVLYRVSSNWLESVIDCFDKLKSLAAEKKVLWQSVSCVSLARYTFVFCIDFLEHALKNNRCLFSAKVADIAHLLHRVESLCNSVMNSDWSALAYENGEKLINRQVERLKHDLLWLDSNTIRRPSVLYALKSEAYCEYLCWLFQDRSDNAYHHAIQFLPKFFSEISRAKCEKLNDSTLALAKVITSLYMDEAFHRIICLAKGDTSYQESGLVRLAPVIESYGYLLESGILDDKDREVADGYIERARLLASCYQSSIPSFVIERLNTLFSETDPDLHEICQVIKVSVFLNFKHDNHMRKLLASPGCVAIISKILGCLHGLVIQCLLKKQLPAPDAHAVIEIFDFSAGCDHRLSGQELSGQERVDVKRHFPEKLTADLKEVLTTKGFLRINYSDRQPLLAYLRKYAHAEMAGSPALSLVSERVKYSCLDIRRDPSTADVEKISTRLAETGYLPKSHSMNNMISSYTDILKELKELKELKGLNSVINKGGMKHWTEQIYTTKKNILYCFHVLNLVKHNVLSGRHIRLSLATCGRYHNLIQLCINHLDSLNIQAFLSKDQRSRVDWLIAKVFCLTRSALKIYKNSHVDNAEPEKPAPYHLYHLKQLEILGRSMLENLHVLQSATLVSPGLPVISRECIKAFHDCLRKITDDIATRIPDCILKRENTQHDESYRQYTREYDRLIEMRKAIWNIEGCLISDVIKRIYPDTLAELAGQQPNHRS